MALDRDRHRGRTAIVTGAGKGRGGIGRGIAARLAAEGAKILVADIDDNAHVTADELRSAEPAADPLVYVGDLAEEAQVEAMVALALARWGCIDILVNNAGGGIIRPFLEHDAASLTETIRRNLWTTLWCCRKVLPHMVERGYGRIVNIGADSVRNGLYDHAGYNAAKGGVHGLTTGLAREFAAIDITINTVAPCIVDTPAVKAANARDTKLMAKYYSVVPKGRGADIDEVAGLVSYLGTPEAAFITGQVVSINGGSTML
jgi:2,3-dihydroxy-2,3-dihydro-p-cumate dehydrogenase